MSKFDTLTPSGDDWMVRELQALRAEVEELRAARSMEATTISAGEFVVDKQGGFKVIDKDTGQRVFFAGVSPNFNGKTSVAWWRDDGTEFLGINQYDNGDQQGAWRDSAGHNLVSDDRAGLGLSRPWIPVPMISKFVSSGTPGTLLPRRVLPIAQVATEQILWEGRIPLVTHPRIDLWGTWGSNSGSSNCTYTLAVRGIDRATWSTTGTELRTDRPGAATGGFDISDSLEWTNVPVTLRCVASGTGDVACEIRAMWLRGTGDF